MDDVYYFYIFFIVLNTFLLLQPAPLKKLQPTPPWGTIKLMHDIKFVILGKVQLLYYYISKVTG